MRFFLFLIFFGLSAGAAGACESVVSLAEADWRAQRGDDIAWAQIGWDDAGWARIAPGQTVPNRRQGTQDGFLWYRLRFNLKATDLTGDCYILLGRIQETDEVYLNGQRIGGEGRIASHWYGFVSAMRYPRSYVLPSSMLVEGENLLAVRTLSLFLTAGIPTESTAIGPAEPILSEAHRLQRKAERIEVLTLTLLVLGALITGFLSLTRQSERQHLMLFGFIVAVTVIYVVDSLLFYPVRFEAAWTKRLVFLAAPLIPVILLQYLSVVSGEHFRRLTWLMALLPAACAMPLFFNQPLDRVMRLYDLWFVSFVPIIAALLLFMLRRARYRMQQSRLLLLACALVAVGLLFTLLGNDAVPGDLNPIELGILGMTAVLMVAFARRLTREYEARLRLSAGVLSAQDEERRRIARELHDGLGQRLVAARLLLEAEALHRPGGQLQEVVQELRDSTRELRAIVHGLRPVELGEVSLRSALTSYGQRIRELTGVRVQIRHSHNGYIPTEVEEHLFRIVQEAVNNAIRHGSAQDIDIEVAGVGAQLLLRIQDDGAGFRLESVNDHGLGLTAMAERVRLCRGHFNVESHVGQGTTIHVEIPLS